MKLLYIIIVPFLLMTNSLFAQSTLSNGILACYDFNGNANDASGNNITGTLYGSPTLAQDRFGNANNAYFFDGVDDYIDINNALLYQPTEWTYSAWVNLSSNPGLGLNSFILEIGGTGAAQALAINNSYTVSNQGFIASSYLVAGTSDAYVLSGTLPILNTWYHVAGIREVDTVRLFVNGVQVQKIATASSSISYGSPTNFATIGARVATGEYFNGYMDNLRIYSRALTRAEIFELYTTEASCTTPAVATGTLQNTESSATASCAAFPNPSKGICTIKFPERINGVYNVEVYDSKGGKALVNTLLDSASPLLDLSSLSKGIYMISFSQNNLNHLNTKVVIE
jgi:hypothetical protein